MWDPYPDRRSRDVAAPAEVVFQEATRIGGAEGWMNDLLVWRLRARADALLGGPGLREDATPSLPVKPGDPIGFWRVVEVESPSRLLLKADTKTPGWVTLGYDIEPIAEAKCRLTQTVDFRPDGWFGRVYGLALAPAHPPVYAQMLRHLAERAEAAYLGG